MADIKFFKCEKCGNVAVKLLDAGVPLMCCGQKMAELTANTVDAAKEKHVPAVTVEGQTVTVKVGEVAHPMEDDHYIAFIYLHTSAGVQYAQLQPGDAPEAVFELAEGVQAIAAYEYCNKHGLWMAQV